MESSLKYSSSTKYGSLISQLLRARFTAGAMGVGKTFVINWLRDNGILSVADFVKINPDKLAKQLPEWVGAWVTVQRSETA